MVVLICLLMHSRSCQSLYPILTIISLSLYPYRRGLAESHAKLNMRSVAIEEDGVMAILIYEESLTSRYGHSILHLIPTPHFRDNNLSAYIGKEVHYHLVYIHVYIPFFLFPLPPLPLSASPPSLPSLPTV